MDTNKRFSITLFMMVSVLFSSCVTQDHFERINTEEAEKIDFLYYGIALERAENEGFSIIKESEKFILAKGSYETKAFKYPIYILDINEDYIALRTGISTLDAGWKYFFVPTYSKIIILNKNNLEVLLKKTIRDRVDMISIEENYIYFGYGDHPNLKFGRFKFSNNN